ncbi:hypothetical protein D1006_40750 [Burkholderia stabilis]|uniref:Uncharacterized protein n=1 Tax=Burkholderia stabilis TaxID=95485 RepID=A0A4Q2A4V6_9BURK|nr:hypothetical protein [Burkholderia stabilis]RXV64137.1 hypothetical protein D1006_40750 [Burkholderia stabilis]
MIQFGDVFRIETSKGSGYFQYVKKVSPMGSLIRILPGTHKDVPENLAEIVMMETNFWIFFPVGAATKRGIIKKVGNFGIPEHARSTPLFRTGIPDQETRKVESWWLWDGEKSWPVGAISEEQRRLPIRGSWNDTLLIERIEQGWLPEKDLL